MTKYSFKKGFTLIELLVVVSIIGILATLVVANLNAARTRARDTVRKADLKNVQTALRLYYNDVGSYPADLTFGSEWSYNNRVYMNMVPNDPVPGQSYSYTADLPNDTFTLTACLENTSDSKCDESGGSIVACNSGTGCLYSLKP